MSLSLKNASNDGIEAFQKNNLRKKYGLFSISQTEKLNDLFSKNPYPSPNDIEDLSETLNLPSAKINNWLKYKRRKCVLRNKASIPNYKNVVSKNNFQILKKFFQEKRNPTANEIKNLANLSNMNENQVISWFTYRRRKIKLSKMNFEKSNSTISNQLDGGKKSLLKKNSLISMDSENSLEMEQQNNIPQIIEKIENTGRECKKEEEKNTLLLKTSPPFNDGNRIPAEEPLKNNNHCYNLGFPSNQNQYKNTKFYWEINMLDRYAYSNMLYDHFMKTKLQFLSSFNRLC